MLRNRLHGVVETEEMVNERQLGQMSDLEVQKTGQLEMEGSDTRMDEVKTKWGETDLIKKDGV